ncbi:MAG: hypothetical protein ABGY71_02665 [bacterium]|jgi:hypothetical protein|nr:hypothetical protein [Planctomycetota bacterium]
MVQPELKALELTMGELLSVLQSGEATSEDIAASWIRCQTTGEAVTTALERSRSSAAADKTLVEALERLVQLNAIARQAVAKEQAALTGRLRHSRRSVAQVRGYTPGAPASGRKCDLAG